MYYDSEVNNIQKVFFSINVQTCKINSCCTEPLENKEEGERRTISLVILTHAHLIHHKKKKESVNPHHQRSKEHEENKRRSPQAPAQHRNEQG